MFQLAITIQKSGQFVSELDNDDRREPQSQGKGVALALKLASHVRNIMNPKTAQFTTFQAIEFLNARKILTFDLQAALLILIDQRIIKQVDTETYESIVEGEGKDVSFRKVAEARREMRGLLFCGCVTSFLDQCFCARSEDFCN